jgi:monovalent cation:H+ antiporter-2, CPA2 family
MPEHDISLILTIAGGLAAALVMGLITHRLGLSPILGYLLAGFAVGPHSPGFVASEKLAPQLAEIGVILLMFGVGMHFQLKDLLAVRKVAVPGAIVQSLVATALGALVATQFGWPLGAGVVLGLAVSVASTVVLLRVLMDNNALNTRAGHVAVGWLVVEDIFTVLVLVLLPAVVLSLSGGAESEGFIKPLAVALLKLAVLSVMVLVGGSKVVPWLFGLVARTRSRELFTLTVLVMAIGIAAGSYVAFGASMALGAFLAGMVVSQSDVHHQAAADALPLRDAFAVLFFVSVGMLFDPRFLIQEPLLVLSVLAIILVGKPLAALLIVLALGQSVRMALTVSVALAQIGEFSFILGEVARGLKVLPEAGVSVLVVGAMISITLNPVLFRLVPRAERALQARPRLWRFLNRHNKEMQDIPAPIMESGRSPDQVRAVVVGHGPVGRTLTRILRDFGIRPVIIEMNVETVRELTREGFRAIYGDASRREILEAARIHDSKYLLVTLPDLAGRVAVIATARMLNPNLRILSRAHYVGERTMLEESGTDEAAYEEAEVGMALAELLLKEVGATPETVAERVEHIRAVMLGKHHVEPLAQGEARAGQSSVRKAVNPDVI